MCKLNAKAPKLQCRNDFYYRAENVLKGQNGKLSAHYIKTNLNQPNLILIIIIFHQIGALVSALGPRLLKLKVLRWKPNIELMAAISTAQEETKENYSGDLKSDYSKSGNI